MYIPHKKYVRKEFRHRIKQVILLMLILNLIMFSLVFVIYMEHYRLQSDIMKSITYTNLQVEQIKKFEQQQLINENFQDIKTDNTANMKVGVFALTAADKEYIIRVCMAEAGASYDGCLAVAQCIYDRSVLWNRTPYEVASAYKQFAQPRQGEIYKESARAVTDVFENHKRAFPETNVTHFFSGEDVPYWVEGKEFVGEMGGNRFFI